MTQIEEINLRKKYKKALIINDILAVHAHRFIRHKFLLLYTVIEKDESHITKDENQNEDAAEIGFVDDDKRKGVMTICHRKIL